ncbi:hypothetical protein CEP52_016796 [Fusarium oligoseptatum]|uniref:Uncharacterized protein n=1 Tax=Fusarium oligoseptatum TaxID=2604345 RepID=A0A428S070_9HYPO|nr:hypothetical protein CEP52_016796 [Fusarium oligoseptatum]
MMTATIQKAEETVCLVLHGKKKTEISDAYFEYAVDHTIWHNWAAVTMRNERPGTQCNAAP